MRFAYADPPYLGQGHHYDHPDSNDWNQALTHEILIAGLTHDYPDGWALSASSPSLKTLLPLCPDDVRVAAWVKPFHAYKKGVRPAYAWEPVIFRGGRNTNHPPPAKGAPATTPKDWLSCNITLQKGLVGAKPPDFCRWVLDLLGYHPDDTVDDLFPGTGIMDIVTGLTPIQTGLFRRSDV
jgi:hypothetical protein